MTKYIYLNNTYMFYFFLENNNIYLSSMNSSRKIKRKLQILFLFNTSNNLIKKYSLFKFTLHKHKYFYKYTTINESKEKNVFNGVFYNFKSKIKIIGRGWKIIKTNYNTLLIKLGYSHPLFLTLSLYVKYKVKKKKKNIIYLMVHSLIKLIHYQVNLIL